MHNARPIKPIISWRKSEFSRITLEDGNNTAKFAYDAIYNYVRSEESFESGSYRFEINVDLSQGTQKDMTFGVSTADSMNGSSGYNYFQEGCVYANHYPSFNKDFTNIHTKTPTKMTKENFNIAVNFDLEEKKIFWEIDGEVHETLDYDNKGKPVYVVLSLHQGTASFI